MIPLMLALMAQGEPARTGWRGKGLPARDLRRVRENNSFAAGRVQGRTTPTRALVVTGFFLDGAEGRFKALVEEGARRRAFAVSAGDRVGGGRVADRTLDRFVLHVGGADRAIRAGDALVEEDPR
jgi:hypothetical protein